MTYDYECSRCGAFTVEQKITDLPLTRCPNRVKRAPCIDCDMHFSGTCHVHPGPPPMCDGKVRRVIAHAPTFALKGRGWFKDGY